MVVIGWVCECLGGSALGRAKDCPLLWVVGCGVVVGLGGGGTVVWGERIAWVVGCGTGTVVLFGDFLNFFFNGSSLGCLKVGGFYGLLCPGVERLGMADNNCVGVVVVMALAQLG